MDDDDHGEEPEDSGWAERYDRFLRWQRATFAHELPDALLAVYVELVDRDPGTQIGITLTTTGDTVSGLLVSQASYAHAIADGLDEAQPENESRLIITTPMRWLGTESSARAVLDDIEHKARPQPTDDDDDDEWFERRPLSIMPLHIHLLDTTIWTSAGPIHCGAWRGRLASVVGFAWGSPSTA